uniref:Putative ovule protein n=1 Tax=Solanum chacoense TaxID=4108 RepID=A0A0V0H8P2_SOLCH
MQLLKFFKCLRGEMFYLFGSSSRGLERRKSSYSVNAALRSVLNTLLGRFGSLNTFLNSPTL